MLNSLKCWFQQLHNKCWLFPQHTKCRHRTIILNITSKFVNSKFGFHQLPFLEPHSQNYPWFHTYKNVGANQHTLKSGKQIPTTIYKLNIIYITNIPNINHYIHVTLPSLKWKKALWKNSFLFNNILYILKS
jgi:hypothetical protein